MIEESPKLFISYSWSAPDHEKWVLNLATELRENGVDVILDKWDLKEGYDAHAFMEKMVTDPTIRKVVLICDRIYAEKADGRSGGVGTETQIISAEMYGKTEQDKFVAVVTEKDEGDKPFLPTYYKSRIYVDLSDNDIYAKNYEQLLHWIYDKPFYHKPELGKKPAFISDSATISLGTTSKYKRALEAIRNNKDFSKGALQEYFEAFTQNLEKFRIAGNDTNFDDKVLESIGLFLPYRNEAIEIFLALAQYRNTPETHQQVHRFFEGLIPYMERPEHIQSYNDWDFDNFKFIVHELFLYATTCFMKYECFDAVSYSLRTHFYKPDSAKMKSFAFIRKYMKSLDIRNTRLDLRRLSLRADLLEERSQATGLKFKQVMQTDFVLFIRSSLDVLKNTDENFWIDKWWPETLLYNDGRIFEIFARAQSKEYFDRLKCLFGIDTKQELEPLWQAFKDGRVPRWEFESSNPVSLMGYDQLEEKP